MIDEYQNMFWERPKSRYKSPLESGDNPEIDQAVFLGEGVVEKYQTLISSIQYTVLGYTSGMRHTVIKFHTGLLCYSELPYKKHDWGIQYMKMLRSLNQQMR